MKPDASSLDDQLATFTDQVLAGQPAQTDESLAELAEVVSQLRSVIAPDQGPSARFREQLTARLALEWEAQHRPPARWWQIPRMRRALALVALVALVALLSVLWAVFGAQGETALEGTAGQDVTLTLGVIVGAGALAVLALAAIYWRRR